LSSSRWELSRLGARGRWTLGLSVARRAGLVALLAACAASALADPAWAQTPATVTTGAPIAVTTTGAVVSITFNPGGNSVGYQVLAGPTGGPLTSVEGGLQGCAACSGTSDVTESVSLTQLAPNTPFTYEAQVIELDNDATTTGTTMTFTTASVPTGPGTPIIPPQNPPANGIFSNCGSDAECVADSNGVRAMQEGLPPFALPTNWSTLTGGEQLFVATNLERINRGEVPIPNLVDTYDASVQTGVQTDSDPSLSNLPGLGESVWAGRQPTPLGAVYGWLYSDGPGGFNFDCTAPTDPGCWGHRDALLDNPGGTIGNPTEMDAIAGTDGNGSNSYAALFVNNPNPTPPGSILFSWAFEQQFLAPPPLGGTHPHGRVPKDRHLAFSRFAFRAAAGRKRPAVVLSTRPNSNAGTIISYTDSQAATTTFTLERQVAGAIKHGRCVAAPRRAHTGTTACVRYVTLGSFTHADSVGVNRFRFMGRLNGLALRRGTYLMTASPRSRTGQVGPTLKHAFKIVP
jgi:hypothetical protein